MKKYIILAVLIIIAGASWWVWQNKLAVNEVTDCGTDTNCFVANFKSCTPSTIYGGATEILGGTPESCEISFTSLDDPRFTGGERLSMNCEVKNTGSFSELEMSAVGVYEKGSCSGSLHDFYKKTFSDSNW